MRPIALVLIVLGIVALAYGGINYNRERTVFDVAGIKATATEQKHIPIAPIAGVIAIVGGVALLGSERRRA